MPKPKEIRIIVHKPAPENAYKFDKSLSEELVKLIELLLTIPR
jgi:hypothetical protein